MADPVRAAVTPPGDDRDRLIAPPSQGFVTGEDFLRLSTFNSMTGVILTVSGRFYDLEQRRIVPFSRTHTPNTDRTLKQTIETLGTGYILNAMVRATSGSPLIGQTYVILEIVRGQTAGADALGVLGADYVTARQGIAFPGSAIHSSIEGDGVIRTVLGSTPAAGVDISETVPTGARWQLVMFTRRLATGVAAANRQSFLRILSTNSFYYLSSLAYLQPAATAHNYFMAIGGPSVQGSASADTIEPLPDTLILVAGTQIQTTTSNIQPADQYDPPYMLVREWLEAA